MATAQDWEYAKVRQDAQLERIERGIGTLGDMARGMQEELDKQNPVIDDIDTQLNKVTGQMKNNNAKLAGLVTQVRAWHCTGVATGSSPRVLLLERVSAHAPRRCGRNATFALTSCWSAFCSASVRTYSLLPPRSSDAASLAPGVCAALEQAVRSYTTRGPAACSAQPAA